MTSADNTSATRAGTAHTIEMPKVSPRDKSLPARKDNQFALISFNTLANVYAMAPLRPDLYDHVKPREALSWKVRCAKIRCVLRKRDQCAHNRLLLSARIC